MNSEPLPTLCRGRRMTPTGRDRADDSLAVLVLNREIVRAVVLSKVLA